MRMVLALSLVLLATPPARANDMTGDADFGGELFAALCSSCHGPDAQGDDRAPDIRGATIARVRRGTSGMDSMQDFGFGDEEVADLHAYLATLAP